MTCPSDQKLSFHFQKRFVFSATLLRDNQKFRREEMESFSPDGRTLFQSNNVVSFLLSNSIGFLLVGLAKWKVLSYKSESEAER